MKALDRIDVVNEQLVSHFGMLVQDLEMMSPNVELIMASVHYTAGLLDENDPIAHCQLERVERARRRMIEALTSAGDLRRRTSIS